MGWNLGSPIRFWIRTYQLAKEEENGSEAQLKLLEDGETQLNISLTKKENIEAYLNLAASAALKYDWGAANDYLAKAKEVENDRQSMSNVLHNSMGALAIAAGNHRGSNHTTK